MSAAINSGDVAWVLASTALVMLMTPALGFFYGGLVRSHKPHMGVLGLQHGIWSKLQRFGRRPITCRTKRRKR